jgi:hypothetical protein
MAFRGTYSGAAGVGNGVAWFLLGEQELNYAWPVLFFFGQLGVACKLVPYSYCPFFGFTTSSALGPTDFNSFGSMAQTGVAVGVGGAQMNENFYSVNHSPNPLPLLGLDIGLGVGIGWCPGRFKVLDSVTVSNAGSTQVVPASALDDSTDLSDAVADAMADYLQNNTDPTWVSS